MKIIGISFRYDSYGINKADSISSEYLRILRSGKILHNQYNFLSKQPVNSYHYQIDIEQSEDFFDKLITEYKILDWKKDYSVDCCDGFHWRCVYRLEDKTDITINGTVEPPPIGEELAFAIMHLISYKVRPRVMVGFRWYDLPIDKLLMDGNACDIVYDAIKVKNLELSRFMDGQKSYSDLLNKSKSDKKQWCLLKDVYKDIDKYFNSETILCPIKYASKKTAGLQKYLDCFIHWGDIQYACNLEESFGYDMIELNFTMDCGARFFALGYPENLFDNKISLEEARNVFAKMDYQTVTSAVISQWRYLTHWSYCEFDKYREFFIAGLETIIAASENKI